MISTLLIDETILIYDKITSTETSNNPRMIKENNTGKIQN